jgi:hypothetical protein
MVLNSIPRIAGNGYFFLLPLPQLFQLGADLHETIISITLPMVDSVD